MERWKSLTAIVGAVVIMYSVSAGAADRRGMQFPLDPIALYGDEIRFDVLRNGKNAGWHRVRFVRNGADLSVSSTFVLQLDVLFLNVFRYRYDSEAIWRKGELERLSVRVDDDGTPFSMEAVRKGPRITITNGQEAFSVDAPLFPTNHWNAGVLSETRVLNTLTGRANRVAIRPVARETVTTERGDISATRYAYAGELKTEVWYDDFGHWVKMRFAGRDGSTIEYICRRCLGGTVKEVHR